MNIPGYSIRAAIGKGGMATAYLAIQESLNREVVLKVLDASNVQSKNLVERFLAEGRIVASLNHPNIITVYDIGVAGDDLYISMEYVRGGDLKQRIEQSLTIDESLDYLTRIAGGLQTAHRHGVIHRDIKPANILFRTDDTPLITDFGIAKQTTIDNELTSIGMFLGSPNYVSPEQADGFAVDGRTDIYSLGCVLYEMLTGNKPYNFNSVIDTVIQHKHAPIPTLTEELAEFQPLLEKMMAKQVEDRFVDCGQLLKAIESARSAHTARLGRNSIATPPDKHPRRSFMIRALKTLLILSALFYGAVLYVSARMQQEPDYTATATTRTVLDNNPSAADNTDSVPDNGLRGEPNREEVTHALNWLGQRSLEEYRLTYPPKDNAYYYFSKLLELEPDNRDARQGMHSIADRYATLAEESLAQNEDEKTRTYVTLGLKIDPDHRALLALRELVRQERKRDEGIFAIIKGWFGQS